MKLYFEFDNSVDAEIEIEECSHEIEESFLKLILKVCEMCFDKVQKENEEE